MKSSFTIEEKVTFDKSSILKWVLNSNQIYYYFDIRGKENWQYMRSSSICISKAVAALGRDF